MGAKFLLVQVLERLAMAGLLLTYLFSFFFFQAEDGIRDDLVTGVQTCALPIYKMASVTTGKAGPLEAFLPVVTLAILFGLSTDYQVFLVSRMKEEWAHSRDSQDRKSVV